MAQLCKRFALNLANTLTGNAKFAAHFLERMRVAIFQAEAQANNLALTKPVRVACIRFPAPFLRRKTSRRAIVSLLVRAIPTCIRTFDRFSSTIALRTIGMPSCLMKK